MKKLLVVIGLLFPILFTSFDVHSLDSLSALVDDARNEHSDCTEDGQIQTYLPGLTAANPLILTWPFRGKISNYREEVEERTHKVLLGYGAWWVNDAGLDAYGSDKGEGHWCWQSSVSPYLGRFVSNMEDCQRLHSGIDINRKVDESDNINDDPDATDQTSGKSVYPVYPGRVLAVGDYGPHWREHVMVQHDFDSDGNYDFISFYAHLGSVDVFDGDQVSLSTKLGSIANLVNSTVHDHDHLHFAIIMRGDNGSGMDDIDRGVITKSGGTNEAMDVNNKYINPSPLCLGVVNKVVKWVDRPLFPDVEMDHWYYPYLLRVHNLGVVEGYPDGNFRPAQAVKRGEFLKLAVESSGRHCCDVCSNCNDCISCSGGSWPFVDVNPADWFYDYVRAAHYGGWIDTVGVNFYPGGNASRRWVAKVLVHASENEGNCDANADSLYADITKANKCNSENIYAWHAKRAGIFDGHLGTDCTGSAAPNATDEYFCGDNPINRAESVKVIENALIKECKLY